MGLSKTGQELTRGILQPRKTLLTTVNTEIERSDAQSEQHYNTIVSWRMLNKWDVFIHSFINEFMNMYVADNNIILGKMRDMGNYTGFSVKRETFTSLIRLESKKYLRLQDLIKSVNSTRVPINVSTKYMKYKGNIAPLLITGGGTTKYNKQFKKEDITTIDIQILNVFCIPQFLDDFKGFQYIKTPKNLLSRIDNIICTNTVTAERRSGKGYIYKGIYPMSTSVYRMLMNSMSYNTHDIKEITITTEQFSTFLNSDKYRIIDGELFLKEGTQKMIFDLSSNIAIIQKLLKQEERAKQVFIKGIDINKGHITVFYN